VILDLEMKTRDLFDLTSPTVRSALLGRELTLGSSEVTLRFGAEMITFLEFTVTCGNLIHDPRSMPISQHVRSNGIAGTFTLHA